MFTGIVSGIARVSDLVDKEGLRTLILDFPTDALDSLEIGASVAIDGVCLTAAKREGDTASFDVMQETLSCTTLGALKLGDAVNFERSAKADVEVGGHLLSGHVDGIASILTVEAPENNCVITFQVATRWMKYIYHKGYIALNGASLTVVEPNKNDGTFRVHLIPETLRLTTFSDKKVGDSINFEIERQTQVMVDTVENFLEARLGDLISAQVQKEIGTLEKIKE